MRKKIMAFVFAAAMLVAMAVPLVGGVGTASADPGGCPNANASNGAAQANDNSAHGAAKQADRGC